MKRFLSLFIVSVFLLSTMMPVFAEDEKPEIPEIPETPTVIQYIYINGEKIEIQEGEAVPVNTASKTETNGNDTHTITTYSWVQSETEENVFSEVVGAQNIEGCSFESTEKVMPTCKEPGREPVHTCSVCNYTKGGEEIAPSAEYHNYVYAITVTPTCTEDGKVVATCEHCEDTYEYVIQAAHQYGEWTQTKAPTCSEKGEETAYCRICNDASNVREVACVEHNVSETPVKINETPATCTTKAKYDNAYYCVDCGYEDVERRETGLEEGEPLGHKWSSSSTACSRCDVKDEIKSVKIKSCSKKSYFVKDSYKADVTLEVECENHTAQVKLTGNCLVFEDGKTFNTKTAETYKCYAVYEGVRSGNSVEITVAKPKINITKDGDKVFAGAVYSADERGISFKVSSTSKNKIQYSAGKSLKVTYDSKKGVYKVTPTKYFDVDKSGQNNHYVKFYFTRNGVEYSKTVYVKCMVSGLVCNTKSSTYTYKKGKTVSKDISLTVTYLDGKTKKFTKKVELDISKAGKRTKKVSYYGETVTYTYYVKCATPTLKATSKSKAVSLSWNKVPDATGYKIYRATSKDGKYSDVATISGGDTTSYKNTGLKSKKTYYYKIVAIYSNLSRCNSSSSSVVKCTTK